MSEGKKRKVRTAKFKAKVGLETVRGVKTISEIAQAVKARLVIHAFREQFGAFSCHSLSANPSASFLPAIIDPQMLRETAWRERIQVS